MQNKQGVFMIYVQRLNLDNSYLIEIAALKVLIDPWLEGSEIDYFPWFNKQWHRTPPLAYSALTNFDAVLITQKYPDHFHAETLKKLQPESIIAPRSLEKKLRKLLPQASILVMDAKNDRLEEKGVQITFFPTKRKIDPIYDAFLLDDGKESIFVAPHGFRINEKEAEQLKASSPCKLLITPFNYYKLPFFLGGVESPGLDGVKHLCDVLDPEKVIASHDEDKHAEGLVTKFARIIRPSSQESLHNLPWLAGRYQEINDYNRIQLS